MSSIIKVNHNDNHCNLVLSNFTTTQHYNIFYFLLILLFLIFYLSLKISIHAVCKSLLIIN